MTIQLLFLIPLFAVAHGASVKGLDMISMIVGGRLAQPGEFPYQVSLQDIPTEHHFCGGVIISHLYILTAAHCVDGRDIRSISVNVGLVDLRDPHAVHLIESSYVHEDYDPSNKWINDIALLRLQSPLQYSRLVAPVELTTNETVEAGSPAVVSGFGRLKMQSPFVFEKKNYLLYVAHNQILDQAECKKIYSDVHDTQICANDPVREQGSCHGDSGGPLTVYGKLIGLVSWAHGCADVYFPTVFTRVPSYIHWIHQHMLSDEFERNNRNLF